MAGILMAWPGTADDLPPEILLLSRIKRHIRQEVGRLPDYTCLQTSARYHRGPREKAPEAPLDTMVVEVLNARDKELFGSPGESGFQHELPAALAAGGLTGTGSFGLFLRDLFVHDNAMFEYGGEEPFRGRRAVRFDYRVPRTLSGYVIAVEFARDRVGMKGSFRVDAETLDLLSLEVDASEISPRLQISSALQVIEYARMTIGDREVTLPQSAAMEMVGESGEWRRNAVEFTHCRSFHAQSTLSFTAPDGAPPSGALPPQDPRPVSRGLTVAIELAAPITASHTVGSLIEGRVAADVRLRGRLAIAAGSAVRGRIRRLEREAEHWAVGLEFTDIETETGTARFYANVQELDKPSGAKFIVRLRGKHEYWLPYLPGVAQFFLPGSELSLPKGFRTVWKTTSPRSATR